MQRHDRSVRRVGAAAVFLADRLAALGTPPPVARARLPADRTDGVLARLQPVAASEQRGAERALLVRVRVRARARVRVRVGVKACGAPETCPSLVL